MIRLKYKVGDDQKISIIQFNTPMEYKNESEYGQDYYIKCDNLKNEITKDLDSMLLEEVFVGENEIELDVIIHNPCDFINEKPEKDQLPPVHYVKNGFKGDYYTYGQEKFLSDNYSPILHFCKISFDDYNKVYNRYANVVDSSIWNFFVKYEIDENDNAIIDHAMLEEAIKSITLNYKRGLYDLNVAKEYVEFNARKTQESYLKPFQDGNNEHAVYVSPFVFHSESYLKKLIEERFRSKKDEKSKTKIAEICNYKWRILLVDDKANKAMTPYDKPEAWRLDTKLKIVESRLKTALKPSSDSSLTIKNRPYCKDNQLDLSCDFLIEYVEDIDSAKEALQDRQYDIILLDYLLGDGQYGYELLKNISTVINTADNKYKKGPSGQLFFIFISAYTAAVNERLLAQGLNRSEDFWHIDTGACPTNTPQLFSYNLLKLMEKRLDDSGIWSLTSDELLRLINVIFLPPKPPLLDISSVRTRARDNYHEVLRLHYNFRRILQDVEVPEDYDEINHPEKVFKTRGSVLATSFMLKNQKLGGLLEHLVQLVHLAAFGTIRQWAEMWEEYIYIRAYFEERGFSITDNNDFKNVCKNIEEYIFDLKRQQR